MEPISLDMIAQRHENGLSLTVWQPTKTAASQGGILILWTPRDWTIRASICGTLGPRVTCYMDLISFDMMAQVH